MCIRDSVCRPRDLGGLGIYNLVILGWALQIRWLWLKKTQPNRLWPVMQVKIHPNVVAMFAASVVSIVGDDNTTVFWTDRWLQGNSVDNLAPALISHVPKQIQSRRTVKEALTSQRGIDDIRGILPSRAFLEFILIWDLVQNVQLLNGMEDQHIWSLTASGVCSSRSAYAQFFLGTVSFGPTPRI